MATLPTFSHAQDDIIIDSDQCFDNNNKKQIKNQYIDKFTNTIKEYMCNECKRKFITSYLLDLHLEEAHSSFFKVAALHNKLNLYKCLEQSCNESFNSPKERKQHYLIHHHNDNKELPPFYLHNRKKKQKQSKKNKDKMEL